MVLSAFLKFGRSLHFAAVSGTTAPADSPRYVPLDAKGFRLAMGLRPLDLDQWIEIGADTAHQLARKAEILATNLADVLVIDERANDACEELFEELRLNLARVHHLELSRRDGEHPLVAASRQISEDLCVLQQLNGQWVLTAASVCFPSRWPLHEKFLRSLDEIHGPVAGYDDTLASPTRSFFDRLTPDRSFWRLNWTLLDDAELFQPAPTRSPLLDAPENWMFRVERQTLRRLATTGAIVFTIRTYVTPASELVQRHSNFARDVLHVLETAPDDSIHYKGWVGLAERWRRWFAADLD